MSARELWDVWNLRVAILVSLWFQVLLTGLANLRKTRRSRVALRGTIWLAYLLADWTAAFAVGLISSGQTNDCPKKKAVNNQLAAFWAPFLLLHLGGPDAITAFSLEDNELWIRHLFGLLIQLGAVVYVFVQSLSNDYWIPTALIFVVGACKYAERTISLYCACLGNFKRSLLEKPDPGPNYAQFMEEYNVLKDCNVPVEIKIEKEPEKSDSAVVSSSSMPEESLDYSQVLVKGYDFFDVFKGLVVDNMFSFHERNESRKFFLNCQVVDAFKVMQVELNFMYDALYTKYGVMHCKKGYFCRLVCTVLTVVCFQQFASHPKHDILLFDKIVTYILLCGAVSLDLLGIYNLAVSDWSIVLAKEAVSSILIRLPFGKRTGRRWPENLYQHSFLRFCLNERPRWLNKIADFIGIKATLDEFKYREKNKCDERLQEFIFEKLKIKAKEAETPKIVKEIYSARGEWVLWDYTCDDRYSSISSSLSDEVEYDESLLLWHIATEMCYFTSSGDDSNRNFCKVISDYMLYLLVMRPTLMSTVAGIAQVRFQDTCEEARKFFKRWESDLSGASVDQRETLACKKLLDVKTVVKPKLVKGDRSKSLLFDACILANDLNKFGQVATEEKRWGMMSRIWVELLSYAASHCRPDVHARQLSEGGELITFVWLLMVHFGLGEQFRIEAGHARAKLLVSNKNASEMNDTPRFHFIYTTMYQSYRMCSRRCHVTL